MSCIYWNNVFYVTGTDIVKCLNYRFEAFGRVIKNRKKFEEGIFSDLRNLKCDSDAILEDPKSPFLDFLYKNSCVRTQKKQKVFHWFSVGHDKLFLDALERDLKRESSGKESSTEAIGEPALSFKYDPSKTLLDQLSNIIEGIPKPLAELADVSTSDYYPLSNVVVDSTEPTSVDGSGYGHLRRQSLIHQQILASIPAGGPTGLPFLTPASIYLQSQNKFFPQRQYISEQSQPHPQPLPQTMIQDATATSYSISHPYGAYEGIQGGYYGPNTTAQGGADVGNQTPREGSYIATPQEFNTIPVSSNLISAINPVSRMAITEEPILIKPDVESDFPLDYFHDSTSSSAHLGSFVNGYQGQVPAQPMFVNAQLLAANPNQPYVYEEADPVESEYQGELEARFDAETRQIADSSTAYPIIYHGQEDKHMSPSPSQIVHSSAGGHPSNNSRTDIGNSNDSHAHDDDFDPDRDNSGTDVNSEHAKISSLNSHRNVSEEYSPHHDNREESWQSNSMVNPNSLAGGRPSPAAPESSGMQTPQSVLYPSSSNIHDSHNRIAKSTPKHYYDKGRIERIERMYYPTPSESGASDISLHRVEPDDAIRRGTPQRGVNSSLRSHDLIGPSNNIGEGRNNVIANDNYQSVTHATTNATTPAYDHAYSALDADYWQRY